MSRKVSDIPCSPETEKILRRKGFVIGEKINYGSFSKVYKAKYEDENIAVKVINLDEISKDYRNKFLPRELFTLQRLKHPNIIKIHKIYNIQNRIFIFMDIAEGGDILEYLKTKGCIPEEQAKIWFRQAVQALAYIHSHGIAHRDLKSENMLLDKNNQIKLTDFGFSRYCFDYRTGKRILSTTYCGSAAYVAPEILEGKPYNPMISDIWSLGVVLFMMVNNSFPFDDNDLTQMIRKQLTRNWQFSERVIQKLSPQIKDLIRKMMEPDIDKRIRLDGILRHSWLANSVTESNELTPQRVSEISSEPERISRYSELPIRSRNREHRGQHGKR